MVIKNKRNITFIHPDLGLGGAERLIVDAAVALKLKGHRVRIVTGYHDDGRAFPETIDGTLKVVVAGRWLPNSLFGRFMALCAYMKMIYVAMYINLSGLVFTDDKPDVVICDQVSACIPFIKYWIRVFTSRPRIMYYCHYPDQLLTTRDTLLKTWYRKPLDYIEEITTGMADNVVVNSSFTKGVFLNTFQRIKKEPAVLYPSINSKLFDLMVDVQVDIPNKKYIFLSLNRFEAKKNIALAIRSLRKLKTCLEPSEWDQVHLVVAGGYDQRLDSSVAYYQELQKLTVSEDVVDHVSFILSPDDAVKVKLIKSCFALLYTPSNEHFGIVPLEAMYLEKPVIAVDSGGPRETVVHKETGYLIPAIEQHFGTHMGILAKDHKLAAKFGRAGKKRFMEKFSFDEFSHSWDMAIADLAKEDQDHSD